MRTACIAGVATTIGLGFTDADARAADRSPALRVAVKSRSVGTILTNGVVRARVRARRAVTVRLTAWLGTRAATRRTQISSSRVLRFERPGVRTVRLRLSPRGERLLGECAGDRVTVTARGRSPRGVHRATGQRAVCRSAPPPPPVVLAPAPPTPWTDSPVTGTPPAAPSGLAMPRGDLPGWRQVFTDDFDGTGVDARKWGTYSGQPAGDPGGWWDPSHVVVGEGVLRLRSYRDPAFGGRWVSGGMSSARALSQTYGRYEVRFRLDAGYGISAALLLWPTADHWPPEIDFAENGGTRGTRDRMTATLHYGEDDRIVQRTVFADFTRWHTIGVEWTPGRLVYLLDGAPWAELSHAGVPSEPMELDAQAQAGTEGDEWMPAPDATTPARVDMELDWVVAYAHAP